MAHRVLTDQDVAKFHEDGYVIAKGLFDAEEMDLLRRSREVDSAIKQSADAVADGEGGVVEISLWNEAAEDTYGLFARCHRVVDSVEKLLGGEVYHWHSKMIEKNPYVGGAWAWHQDYGYWYYDTCLFPDLASVMIAVDPANKENGCLQVLKRSHRIGRIDHIRVGDQQGADRERVEEAKKTLELVHCILEIGDALFFHCNLLHRSDQNRSPNPRWALICCYNLARNSPFKESRHARYARLEKVPDEALRKAGVRLAQKAFFTSGKRSDA